MAARAVVAEEYACLDAILGVSRVFRLTRPDETDTPFLYKGSENRGLRSIRWSGPKPLGPSEQTLLLVLHRLLHRTSPAAAGRCPSDLLHDLQIVGDYGAPVLHSEIRWTQLVRALGKSRRGGRTTRLIRESLQRLADVTVTVVSLDQRHSSRLIASEAGRQTIRVALCPRLSERLIAAHLGTGNGLFSIISLTERSRLTSDPAKLLHAWLSVWLRQGRSRTIRVTTLEQHVWSHPPHPANRGRRRAQLLDAIGQIAALPMWEVSVDSDIVTVARTANKPARRSRSARTSPKTRRSGRVAHQSMRSADQTLVHPSACIEKSSESCEFGFSYQPILTG
jgi:hypothetical protein